MDIMRSLNLLKQWESKMAELYTWFGELFKDNLPATELFQRMAGEEIEHHDILVLEIRLASADSKMMKNAQFDMTDIQKSMAWLDQLRASPPTNLDEAVLMAIRWETSAAEAHFRTIFDGTNPGIAKLVKHLGGNDLQHRRRLMDFGEKLGLALPQQLGTN